MSSRKPRSKVPAAISGIAGGLVFIGVGVFWADTLISRASTLYLGSVLVVVGVYLGAFRVRFDGHVFTAFPAKKTYGIGEIAFWRMHEDSEEPPGCRRHLELRFDSWYRRYNLSEEEITPIVFDQLLQLLDAKKKPNQAPEPMPLKRHGSS